MIETTTQETYTLQQDPRTRRWKILDAAGEHVASFPLKRLAVAFLEVVRVDGLAAAFGLTL